MKSAGAHQATIYKIQEFNAICYVTLSSLDYLCSIVCVHSSLYISADQTAISFPSVLLQKAMDPPQPDVVDDALNLLVHIRALEKASPRGHHEPTFYGRLLASFSLSFDASILIIKFGEIGMLREGIVFGILMDLQPLPILSPFGQENRVLSTN